MREEEEPSWFARWEEELPSPEELMPLSQTLITPDLALAFDIPTPHSSNSSPPPNSNTTNNNNLNLPPPSLHPPHHHQPDFDDLASTPTASASASAAAADEPARTLKRPRLVWTPQLHKRFVDAVAHLGIKNAVPKTIMQLMSVDGLTRENVASHLQKYRLYLKRMQGLTSSSAGGAAAANPAAGISAADDQLFATGPIPHHFLARGASAGAAAGPQPEPFVPSFVHVAALHQQQIAAAAAAQHQYYHQRGMGQFDHGGFLARAQPQHRMGAAGLGLVQTAAAGGSYGEDLEPGGRAGGGRRELTLFPTGED